MMCYRSGVAALAIGLAAGAASADVLTDWNLVVRHDLNNTSEVDGSALVGGSVFGTMNFAVHGVTAASGDALALGGNVPGGSILNLNSGGNLRIAGNRSGIVNFNGGGSQVSDAGVPALVDNVFDYAAALNAAYAALPSNGVVDGAGNMHAAPVLMGGQMVAVYSLTNAQLNSLGQLNLNFGSANTVVVNVIADAMGVVDFSAPPNFVGGLSQSNSSRILWNLIGATSVKSNTNFNGALIAPDADLQLLGGGMNGTIIVDNVSKMQAEVRASVYTGYVPPVPGPGTAGLLAFGGLMTLRRRRA